MSLAQKFVLTFLLVVLVPLGVIIRVSYGTLVEHAQQQIGTRLEDSVVQVGKSIDQFMLSSIWDMKSLAADPDVGSE
jgi:hypothetical protein